VTRNWKDWLAYKQREHGESFDAGDLPAKFVPYFENGQRIKVRLYMTGEVMTGTVGVTTGWRPAFLLMRRRSDRGSSHLLKSDTQIIAVQDRPGGKYRNLL
jgi:hypothetical protein